MLWVSWTLLCTGFSLRHIAVSYGNYEMCKTLLESGADVKVLKSNDETPERTKRQNEHL